MKRPPLYLQQRGSGTLHVRIAIPKDVQPYFHAREIKRSLRTTELPRAWGMACHLASQAQQAFKECRSLANSRNQPPVLHHVILRLLAVCRT